MTAAIVDQFNNAPDAADHLIAPELVCRGDDGAVRLRVSRCAACGHENFPAAEVCPNCLSQDMTTKAVDGAGTLYSFSIVHAAPKHWNAPYALGYVDLPGGLRVLGQVQPAQNARIGAACRLELGVVGTRPDGNPAVSYVFVPED